MNRRILFLLGLTLCFGARASANNFEKRADARYGVEINLLWLLPPFRTYEIKFTRSVSDSVDVVMGWGSQQWTYQGERHNNGRMRSNALLVGARGFPSKSDFPLEYTAWIAKDVFDHVNGKRYQGWSLSQEFYVGYFDYLGDSRTYILPQWSLGFYTHKNYELPLNDRYTIDSLPKISVGHDYK